MQEQQQIVVTHAIVTGDAVPEAALHAHSKVYLIWDSRAGRVFVVQWVNGTKWRCSCHNGACAHKQATNDYALALSQARRMKTDDLGAHLGNERGAGR